MLPGWVYHAQILDVIDGDTVKADLDLGFKLHMNCRIRLVRCNARELSEPGGQEAKEHLTRLLSSGETVLVSSARWDKYSDRIDADLDIYRSGSAPVNVTNWMIEGGYAAAWDGRGKRPVPPWPIVPT